MGGSSFLLNKRFHPGRLDNQKAVFIAEQKKIDEKEKENEAAKEVMKEREISYYENLGEIQSRDPRQSSLKFMYSAPAVSKSNDSKMNMNSTNSSNGDTMVDAFWSKIEAHKNKQILTTNEDINDIETKEDEKYNYIHGHPKINPLRKNAPTEGSYVKGMANPKVKPFNDLIRNVVCSHCK